MAVIDSAGVGNLIRVQISLLIPVIEDHRLLPSPRGGRFHRLEQIKLLVVHQMALNGPRNDALHQNIAKRPRDNLPINRDDGGGIGHNWDRVVVDRLGVHVEIKVENLTQEGEIKREGLGKVKDAEGGV